MSFVKLLQGIGDRLGILESVSVPGTQPAKRIQTRSVSLQELSCEIKSGEIRALADSPSELSVPLDKIYETAGISSSPQDWTIERLRKVVAAESLKNKSREEIQRAVLDLLNSEGASVESIVKDAMARDEALDSYEAFVGKKLKTRMESCSRRRMEIDEKIRSLQDERKELEAAEKSDEEKWREWRKLKQGHERELAMLMSYIVDHKVITLTEEKDA